MEIGLNFAPLYSNCENCSLHHGNQKVCFSVMNPQRIEFAQNTTTFFVVGDLKEVWPSKAIKLLGISV